MILLWGLAADPPLALVRAALSRVNQRYCFLDQQAVLHCSLDLSVDGGISGSLGMPDRSIDLATITAVYARPYDVRQIEALDGKQPGEPDFDRALLFEDALSGWLEMTGALVVNRPSAMASNGSKPYQIELIRAAGFDVPETLVTTDIAAVSAFSSQHNGVIYKSISGIRSIVTRLGPEHRERLPDVSHCPTQFQEYIVGLDIRVHVVGDDVYGCSIISDASDYRYPAAENRATQVQGFRVPDDLADRCRRLTADLGLALSGIDLRCTSEGRYYCFEANPSPGFSFYEQEAGQPIGDAIARLLMQAS